jgi:cyclic beta-1,2-glucan synthetase
MDGILDQWRRWMFAVEHPANRVPQTPLRAELFGVEQLMRHAHDLAQFHQVTHAHQANTLLERLDENETALRLFNQATLAVDPGRHITPAAEWLLDNFYLIEEQIQMARRHLPRKYSAELPRLLNGPSAGLPRVYDIVLELISHVDAQIDAQPLSAFIGSYQKTTGLKLGELWAIPIMLRLGLIENLMRITTRLSVAREDRDLANLWIKRLQEMAQKNPSLLVIVVADMAKSDLPLSCSFVAEFCQQLSRESPVLHLARTWLEQRLGEQGLSIEQLVHQESQNQAADQVSISHSISSLRFLGAMNWKEFVETLSQVESELRRDPADIYSKMDFSTRDQYRHAVELLARHSALSELEVAQLAVQLAEEGMRSEGIKPRIGHVGHYLVDKGQGELFSRTRVRWPWNLMLERNVRRLSLTYYLGGLAALTVLFTLGGVGWALKQGAGAGLILALAAILLLSSSQMALAVMNWWSTLLVRPSLLPRLDYISGIPPDCQTMLVVPTLLNHMEGVEELLEKLEIHHLSNRDEHLTFALLTDFCDAPTETQPEDAPLLKRVREGVEMLNRKYLPGQKDLFYLFHRPRVWNAREGLWMGHERKRGKLKDFNALIQGGGQGCFSEQVGDATLLPSIKYVITLDTDTQMPRDAARLLVGTMAHPLNRPVFDPVSGVVREGYGILQPRVGVSLPTSRRSWFVRLFAGDAGIDPYTREVSDVYQDLFQEGSYTGKGIYDVGAFERAMAGRFPENAVLSHDLLEGCHARSGLVSDVEFYEDYPSRYNVDVDRRHRWIRGDWQIAPWLLSLVPGAGAARLENPLSRVCQWKIFDNLRRSLVPVALMVLLLGVGILLPEEGGAVMVWVVGVLALPGLLAVGVEGARKPSEISWLLHFQEVARSGGRHLSQIVLSLAFLPYEAFISLDAVGRTLVRMCVTRRRLLQWKSSAESESGREADRSGFYAAMWVAPAVSLLGVAIWLHFQAAEGVWMIPLFIAWLAAPWMAWKISQPIASAPMDLSGDQLIFLGRVARRTWRFFETFVTAEENWLPPDNYQEEPVAKIASRTSPTNMGLALLANLSARDFGYLSLGGLIERTRNALATMRRLERHRGHFYNWYDTRSLQPLQPLYVSSVDSGNLAGHLLTLAAGLREQVDEPIVSPRMFQGLRETAQMVRELDPQQPVWAELQADLLDQPETLQAVHARLSRVLQQVSTRAEGLPMAGQDGKACLGWLQSQGQDHLRDLQFLAPWLATSEGRDPERIPTLRELAMLDDGAGDSENPGRQAGLRARNRMEVLEELAGQFEEMAAMDFRFLFDPSRKLFHTGFNLAERRCDLGYYDLLASEARLGSYVAIALGQVPQDHWFSMGRLLIAAQGEAILISWSGSMFEYLMPMLVMPNYENTLLDRTCRAAVKRQIEYGRLRGVPWGISESGYHRTDVHLNYQYRAFGVPGLGLKRGLAEDLVIAPYATAMALMIDPQEACQNLQRLAGEGFEGALGFYEAIDYTPSRLPPGETRVVIKSYMAHHQGMSLLALDHVLLGSPMTRRFMASPLVKAADLLLQERVPKATANVYIHDLKLEEEHNFATDAENAMRLYTDPASPEPEVHLLSNGRYHVAITSSGGGYSRWNDLAVTRWREDGTRDCWGTFVYVRDPVTDEFWSTAYQPTHVACKSYEAIFTQARVEFRHSHNGLNFHTEISVSPEDDVELRRITIHNRFSVSRTIELTSYAEVVLASQGSDASHPAFNNLFVQTEFLPQASAVLCTRRARSEHEKPPWLWHLLLVQGTDQSGASCETDRSRFIGRGGTLRSPEAMKVPGALSNTVGSVLDPVVSLRRSVTLPPHESVVIDLATGVGGSREEVLALVEKYQSVRMVERAFDLAWTHSQVILHQLNASEAEAQIYSRLAGALIYADPARRAHSGVLRENRRGQSSLWSYGISGDVPVVLLRISDPEKMGLVQQSIRAHSYWRMKGLPVELVILIEDVSLYRQSLSEQIAGLIASGIEAQMLDKPGGIFVRRIEQVPREDLVLLQSVARLVIDDEKGTFLEQAERKSAAVPSLPLFIPSRSTRDEPPAPLAARELIFNNGFGGFTPDGREYVTALQPGEMTPAPWVNVIANPTFGTVVSESGGSYTWLENAHEFRLTPWSNDPVQDTPGEVIYIRDEQTGKYWSPTPLPAKATAPHVIRHGFGYTVFEHTANGIVSELWIYVAMDAPVKFMVLKTRNASGRPRRLSVTGYWEWVLGDLRQNSLMHVQTEMDIKTGALLAHNPYNTEFAGRTVFVDVGDATKTVTGDRKEFLGRNGSPSDPAAMQRARLSGRVGAGLDPCGAVQVTFDLADGQARETHFRMGVGRSPQDVQELIQRFRRVDADKKALEGVWAHWNRTLGMVRVETPDPAVNIMANGWLLYQTLSSRLWGRTGFYQSGGAYGFRDQLQDVMALVHAEPALARQHLLRAAVHQFSEGDVQHWWHPPSGRGVRTSFSDDFLWLPHVVCRYVTSTADTGVLDEVLPFLESRPVKPEEESYYDLPGRSEDTATLYEHCVRAIKRGLKFGQHGMPLIGCGDWNDGMNRVGHEGRGESVWLAFFLHDVLVQFSLLAGRRNDPDFATLCRAEADTLKIHIEAHGWDGEWYRRAYFDDGTPLGSKGNPECQMDSLPQSWSVISGAGDVDRSRRAMESVDQRLVRRGSGLVQLFDPPFDRSSLNPGYIKGYIPGVRENGGQYTHAAIWTAMAWALLDETEKAWELFHMLNPIQHGCSPGKIATYKVEPYVVAADVYAVEPHVGRGGWTWYTGSAGWMYRLLVETLLGLNLEGEKLTLKPRLPEAWPSYQIDYRYRSSVYHITIVRGGGEADGKLRLSIDGKEIAGASIPLVDDGKEHGVECRVC